MQVISIICSVLFCGVTLIPIEVAYGTICYFDLLSVHSHCILHGDCVTPLNYSQTPNKSGGVQQHGFTLKKNDFKRT